jgi:anaerobic selenocysteine-containing dehydrogenase
MSGKVLPQEWTRRRFLETTTAMAAVAALGDDLFGETSPALVETARETTEKLALDEWRNTACWIGKQGCVTRAHVVDGTVVRLVGHPDDPRSRGRICLKGRAELASLYDPYRVKVPLKRTNEKGVPGEWTEISWDEALDLVAGKIKEVRARDKRLLAFQSGGKKRGLPGRAAFQRAAGTPHHLGSGTCYQTLGNGLAYTIGFNHGLHADLRHCDYLLVWGTSLNDGGPNGLCWITWQHQMREARERGMKVVLVDPRREAGAAFVDEWLPIRPATDLALLLTLAHVLIDEGYLDRDYLLRHTNAPFLVGEDGSFLRSEDKELVWDAATGSARPFDNQGITPALEGSFAVDGTRARTAFQMLREHVEVCTPEWASEICGLPARTIRRVAQELGDNARIGSTVVLDGVELPHRPVGMMSYHGLAQQELGFQTGRAAASVFMLMGAVHAVGGLRSGFELKVHPKFEDLDAIEIQDPPYDIKLTNSRFYPINSGNNALAAQVMLDPDRYGVDSVPEVLIGLYGNPALALPSPDTVLEAYGKFKFMAVIEPHLTEVADHTADVVLPACTLEKHDGPVDVQDQYHDGWALRLPPVPPLYQSRVDFDIYADLCARAGILKGEGGFVDHLNDELQLTEPYRLDLNEKPDIKDVFDRWARSRGVEEGLRYFEEKGLKVSPIPVKEYYAPAWDPPYGGIRHRLYGESLLRYRKVMQEKGASRIHWQDFTALPSWRSPTMNQSPPEFDLNLIDHKVLALFHSQATFNPLLHELEPEQRLKMNTATGRSRGIGDGDWVWVESHNAVTGQTKKVKVKAKLVEGLAPDTVGLSHGYGHWVHPVSRGSGPASGSLYFTGEGYVATPDAGCVYRARVRVQKA